MPPPHYYFKHSSIPHSPLPKYGRGGGGVISPNSSMPLFHPFSNMGFNYPYTSSREGHWWDISHVHKLFACHLSCSLLLSRQHLTKQHYNSVWLYRKCVNICPPPKYYSKHTLSQVPPPLPNHHYYSKHSYIPNSLFSPYFIITPSTGPSSLHHSYCKHSSTLIVSASPSLLSIGISI